MSDTTASIAPRGCNATGITETVIDKTHLGQKIMAVVELECAAHTEKADGTERKQFRIVSVEPAPNSDVEDHLRNLQRSSYYERKVASDGRGLLAEGEEPEPTVKDVLGQGDQFIPHPFEPDEHDDRICNLCGAVAIANVHHDQEEPDDEQEPEEIDDEDPATDQSAPAADVDEATEDASAPSNVVAFSRGGAQ